MSDIKERGKAEAGIEALRREVEVLIQQACERIELIDHLIARTKKRGDVEADWREALASRLAAKARVGE
jgi:hypothetical protein